MDADIQKETGDHGTPGEKITERVTSLVADYFLYAGSSVCLLYLCNILSFLLNIVSVDLSLKSSNS